MQYVVRDVTDLLMGKSGKSTIKLVRDEELWEIIQSCKENPRRIEVYLLGNCILDWHSGTLVRHGKEFADRTEQEFKAHLLHKAFESHDDSFYKALGEEKESSDKDKKHKEA